jgi:methyl-accepting chemotaxis protein
MRNALTLKKIFTYSLICTALLAILTLGGLLQANKAHLQADRANEARYQSYLLADELRQSSDDLTRLARTYVVTGDPSYEKQYFDILDIRNGKKPRPQHYERIYWDFVAGGISKPSPDGETIALQELMKKAGFSEHEFAKLKEAQAASDDLVKAETIAMNAVKGLFDDGAGNFSKQGEPNPEMARGLVHDANYHKAKAKIMKPVNEFFESLDQRTGLAVAQAQDASRRASMIAIAMLAFSLIASASGLLLIYHLIRTQLEQSVNAAQKIAAGDLSVQLNVDRDDELGRLMKAINGISQGLAGMIANVRQGIDTIATASSEISSGNHDLSSRTEQQASSLEETASSMEELTSTVKQNADNARQANQLAASASGVAVKGGNVVSQVVETMGSINASSKKIVDIISVIDGIAFQTNILALNAAVEAARAGEQGRGFAVVASEVRNLAQRSAAAAKEIKMLIDDSVEKVDAGSRLVGEAGSTMDEIVESVKRVTDIMAEIMAASEEQSAGIEQVNQAIGQMDQTTQQNAALVEQAAAAAESLQEQASSLAQAVSVFRLSGHQVTAMAVPGRPTLARENIAGLVSQSRPAKRMPAALSSRKHANMTAIAGSDWKEF